MSDDSPTLPPSGNEDETILSQGARNATPTENWTGRTVGGYEIRRPLGQGGMGVVYVAYDPQLDRELALKTVRAELLGEDGKQRFLREARACSRVQHPHVVTVYAAGEEGGDPWMAMELLSGRSLRQVLKEGKPDWEQSVRWFLDVLAALAHLHRQGILHRDLKPDNIMITDDGPKLVDFGLAHVADAPTLTVAGSTLGTVNYMSPEQVEGKPADERSDIFAMGIILQQLLTGELPFQGEHPMSVMFAIQSQPPKPIDSSTLQAPREILRCIRRALEKDPGKRFASASEFREALATLLPETQATARSRRLPWLLAGIAVVAAAAIFLLRPSETRNRTHAQQLNDLGAEAEAAGDLDGARQRYRESILADDSYAVPFNNLAMLAVADERWAEADSLLRRATSLDSTYTVAYFNRGATLEELGRPHAAARSYRLALRLDPAFAQAANNLSWLLQELSELEEAAQVLDDQLQRPGLDPEIAPYPWRTRARVHLARGEIEAARTICAERELPPDEASDALCEQIALGG